MSGAMLLLLPAWVQRHVSYFRPQDNTHTQAPVGPSKQTTGVLAAHNPSVLPMFFFFHSPALVFLSAIYAFFRGKIFLFFTSKSTAEGGATLSAFPPPTSDTLRYELRSLSRLGCNMFSPRRGSPGLG